MEVVIESATLLNPADPSLPFDPLDERNMVRTYCE